MDSYGSCLRITTLNYVYKNILYKSCSYSYSHKGFVLEPIIWYISLCDCKKNKEGNIILPIPDKKIVIV